MDDGGLAETQHLAGHDGFEDSSPLASRDIHTGLLQISHAGNGDDIALGSLSLAWNRDRYVPITINQSPDSRFSHSCYLYAKSSTQQ